MKKLGTSMFLFAGLLLLSAPGASAATTLGPDWVAGDGVWVIDSGVCVCAALDSTDPKHAWVNKNFGDNYTVRADIRIDTWKDGEDMSRAGISVRIQPDVRDGVRDDGLNILFHDSLGRAELLNDMQSWGPAQEAFDWEVGTWYTMELTIDGEWLTGSIVEKGGTEVYEMTPWDIVASGKFTREGGFPGLAGNSNGGGIVSFDNFQVIVDGEVVFEDNFETPGQPIETGLSSKWSVGDGVWVVHDGSLYCVSVNRTDPKHAWVAMDVGDDYAVQSDVRIDTWLDDNDYSRAGVSVRIQPDVRDGDRDDGLNLLFHHAMGRVELLNDMQSWGPAQESFDWTTGTWYTLQVAMDEGFLIGTVNTQGGTGGLEMTPWDIPGSGKLTREGGYAGLAGNSEAYGISAFDNFSIMVGGQTVFSDSFDEFVSPTATSGYEHYELYK